MSGGLNRGSSRCSGGSTPEGATARCHLPFRGVLLPLPQGRYSPRSSVWGEPEEGAGVWGRSPGYDFPWASSSWGGGCRHIGSRDRGGGTCPPPRLPLPPRRYLPRSSVWGESEEGAGVWVRSPGYGLPRVSSSWGGGCWHIESREIGAGGAGRIRRAGARPRSGSVRG